MNTKLKFGCLAAITAIALAGCVRDKSPVVESKASKPKHIILMVADGIGFNGWLAADYYQGRAGAQSYQVVRPDGTQPVLFGLEHTALNLVDEKGNILPKGADTDLVAGAVPQMYDPMTRWNKFEKSVQRPV